MLWWFGAGETTFPYALSYMTIYLCGTFFALMTTGMNQFIICQGFAKVGMKAVMIGAVANIVLDPIFIFGLHLDVRGAALATVLSQMCSCFYVLSFLFGKKVPIRITFYGYDPRLMLQVARVGFSPFVIIALDNVLIISQNMVIQRLGGPGQGDTILTCAAIVQSFMLIITMPLGGITSGTQTILGYNYGAKGRTASGRPRGGSSHVHFCSIRSCFWQPSVFRRFLCGSLPATRNM
ncbi:MAG: polysaccharide biosynthesis C-terminal domain-containing protein [Clostridium sp.]